MNVETLHTYMNICRAIGREPTFAGLREYNEAIKWHVSKILQKNKQSDDS